MSAGKGDTPRPLSVSADTYAENWARTFRRAQSNEPVPAFDKDGEPIQRPLPHGNTHCDTCGVEGGHEPGCSRLNLTRRVLAAQCRCPPGWGCEVCCPVTTGDKPLTVNAWTKRCTCGHVAWHHYADGCGQRGCLCSKTARAVMTDTISDTTPRSNINETP